MCHRHMSVESWLQECKNGKNSGTRGSDQGGTRLKTKVVTMQGRGAKQRKKVAVSQIMHLIFVLCTFTEITCSVVDLY